MTKVLKAVCSAVCIAAMITGLGFTGGLELDTINISTFIKCEIVCIALICMSIKSINLIKNVEDNKKVR